MSEDAFIPLQAGGSRIFIIEGTARPDHAPTFKSCWRAAGITKGLGDVEMIECPSPDQYNQFVDIGEVQQADERPTTSLVGRYPNNELSEMLRIGKKRCRLDVQIHMGTCTDPKDFAEFNKAVIFEEAYFTNYSTDDMGALGSDENAVVNETVDLSARRIYEVLPLEPAERGASQVTVELVDVVFCDDPACGDCEDESDGCEQAYAVSVASAGSVGTAPDVVFTVDGGLTWTADDINSLLPAEDANALACLNNYIVVVSNDSNSLHYKSQADVNAAVLNGWTENALGFVPTFGPNDIWSVGNYAFIAADTGYVYGVSDPTSGVTVLDAGIATTQDLQAVHALDEEFAVAVGNSDAIVYTKDQITWQASAGNPGTGANLMCVWIWDRKTWMVGTSGGELWYTIDEGVNWTQITIPGTGYDEIADIAFSTKSVGYIAANTTTPRGRILRTYSAGGGSPLNAWKILPEGVGSLPLNDDINAVAACKHDPNKAIGVGLADGGTDGIIIVLDI